MIANLVSSLDYPPRDLSVTFHSSAGYEERCWNAMSLKKVQDRVGVRDGWAVIEGQRYE